MSSDDLIKKINDRSAVVGVIGLGYVGLPLIMAFSGEGFTTIGFDVDAEKCSNLNSGKSYINHIKDSEISSLTGFTATTDFARISEADAVLICVPTPLTVNREPDMTYILSTLSEISPYIRKGQLICLESTTYPGTTEDLMISMLETESGMQAGIDFFAAFSPEREDPNNREFSTATIPKVVGGHTEECLEAASVLYASIVEQVVPVSSTKTAEAVKLMENIFRAVNIALVNELKVIFDQMGIDVWEVIKTASTKPFGYMPFFPGPGLGGHCIPIDPFYLSWKAREYGVTARFIELAGEINRSMPGYVLQKVTEVLNSSGKPMKGSSILLVGMAYKPDVDDMRESPALKLMRLFEKNGATVAYHDPYIPVLPKTREYADFTGRASVALDSSGEYDCVVIATAHSGLDYSALTESSVCIVDTRNACPDGPNVHRA